MYPNLVSDLQRKLTGSEWNLVEYYILKADSLGDDGPGDKSAREALEDAIAVAIAAGEMSVANKIHYYLRFY